MLPDNINPEDYPYALKLLQKNNDKRGYLVKWHPHRTVTIQFYGFPTFADTVFLRETAAFNSLRTVPFFTFTPEEGSTTLKVYYAKDEEDFHLFLKENGADYKTYTSLCLYSSVVEGERLPTIIMIQNLKKQTARNAVLLHELMHGFGFEHTVNWPNFFTSIMGGFFRWPVQHGLSSADLLAFKMLYNPDIKQGCTFEELKSYYDQNGIKNLLVNSYYDQNGATNR